MNADKRQHLPRSTPKITYTSKLKPGFPNKRRKKLGTKPVWS